MSKLLGICGEKISFCTLLTQWNPNVSHLCGCCEVLADETVDHSLKKGEVADSLWRYFACAGSLLGQFV